MLDELEDYGAQHNEDGSRKDDHLIVGLVSYPEFCSRYRVVKQTAIFRKFTTVLSGVFEAVLFAELHWKLDVMRSVERMILGPTGDDYQQ
jgi:hypothetical protein